MERLRIKGKGFGQVNSALLTKYKEVHGLEDKSLNQIAKGIIEPVFGKIKKIDDIYEVEQYVKDRYYRSIGDYLDYYMRNTLERDNLI